MCQEGSDCWKELEEGAAGGNELERSESEFTPATPPDGEGPVERQPAAEGEQLPLEDTPAEDALIDHGISDDDLPGEETGEIDPDDLLDWEDEPPPAPNLGARRRGTLSKPAERPTLPLSPTQKLLLLDTWARSGLPARDFGALVNISRHTLYSWKHRFEQLGPAGVGRWDELLKSIHEHIIKTSIRKTDYLVIDLTGHNSQHITEVEALISRTTATLESQGRKVTQIKRIGF